VAGFDALLLLFLFRRTKIAPPQMGRAELAGRARRARKADVHEIAIASRLISDAQ
jgi:hypothetical protein